MSYELAIHPDAEKEWMKLDGSISRFKEKLANERLKHPRVARRATRIARLLQDKIPRNTA